MVIYSVATSGMMITNAEGKTVGSVSVGQLFMAGMVPGIVLAFILGGVPWYRAWQDDYPRMPKAVWRERWQAFRGSFWDVMLIVIPDVAREYSAAHGKLDHLNRTACSW